MKRADILRGRLLFKRVVQDGKRVHGRLIRCSYLVEPASKGRMLVGFKVFAKMIPAVRRNRIRRLMREAVRRERHLLEPVVNGMNGSLMMILVFKGTDAIELRTLRLRQMQDDVRTVFQNVAERIANST